MPGTRAPATPLALLLLPNGRYLSARGRWAWPGDDCGNAGAEFDPATTERGSGLQNMEDRMNALGGSIDVTSAKGRGTRVTGSIPLAQTAGLVVGEGTV